MRVEVNVFSWNSMKDSIGSLLLSYIIHADAVGCADMSAELFVQRMLLLAIDHRAHLRLVTVRAMATWEPDKRSPGDAIKALAEDRLWVEWWSKGGADFERRTLLHDVFKKEG